MSACFHDRRDAGRKLAAVLASQVALRDGIVLALPRGGVPVGFEVATRLGLPLDALVVRKIGAPWHEEYALGAVAGGGVEYWNQEAVAAFSLSAESLRDLAARQHEEVRRREKLFRRDRPFPEVGGRTVILVDDGIATGATFHAAIRATQALGARRIVAAIPVATRDAVANLEASGVTVAAVAIVEGMSAVGEFYEDFTQVPDGEVAVLLNRADAAYNEKQTTT